RLVDVARAHAIPKFLLRVVSRIGNFDRVEDVDAVTATNLQQISRHDCGGAANLRTVRYDNSRTARSRNRRAPCKQRNGSQCDKKEWRAGTRLQMTAIL